MTATPANLRSAPEDESPPFAPYASDQPPFSDYDYIQEEWIATGDERGRPYATTVLVRRPRDFDSFSGTVIVEPLHAHGITPIWIYTAPYILRSGHAWVEVASQKTALDMHVKGSQPERYRTLHIEGPDTSTFDPNPRLGDSEASEKFWSDLESRNGASSTILAQVGAALKETEGPFAGKATQLILAGHSQTGSVTTYYIRDAHDAQRLADGSPIFDGFFPTGYPEEAFHAVDVPIVQVMSDGDIALPDFAFRPGRSGRRYRREDSDNPGDRYRLYELAGVPHMGTRVPPYDDRSLWEAQMASEPDVILGPKMNSLPHFELFSMCLHHLVEWVAHGIVPPRAERLEVGPDGYFVKDEHGNTVGGVRCVQLDVPHSTYLPNPLNRDGTPSYLTVGNEMPFDIPKLQALYGSANNYISRFDRRLADLIDEGWLLSDDAASMQSEALQVTF